MWANIQRPEGSVRMRSRVALGWGEEDCRAPTGWGVGVLPGRVRVPLILGAGSGGSICMCGRGDGCGEDLDKALEKSHREGTSLKAR